MGLGQTFQDNLKLSHQRWVQGSQPGISFWGGTTTPENVKIQKSVSSATTE